MSPPRRRSARLASATVKSKATPELSSVTENDERSGPEPQSINNALSSPQPTPATPVSSAIKPSHDEMHPSKAHMSTAKPSSALRLGFTDIKPSSNGDASGSRAQDTTPSKTGRGMPSSAFTFRVAQQAAETELSQGAKQMMEELRERAAQIKADLAAQREAEGGSADISGRKFAQPKRQSGRFSAAHMAEFKKMDSIEGHASAWRAQNGRFTPVKSGTLKRSPSKANLDGTPTSAKSTLKRSPSKPELEGTPRSAMNRGVKRTSTTANLDARPDSTPKKAHPVAAPSKLRSLAQPSQIQSAKRIKKRQEDDASSSRPPVKDANTTPKPAGSLPKSNSRLARLTSPTKSSLAHLGAQGKPTVSLVDSPSKPSLAGLAKSATADSLQSPSRLADAKRRIISPGRFQKVKSILRRQKPDDGTERTAIPHPTAQLSQTPGPSRVVDKELPPLPLTTPRRKLTKKVAFTPDTAQAAVQDQNSPSPKKFGTVGSTGKRALAEIQQYPALDGILADSKQKDVVYPDLSSKLQSLNACSNDDAGQKTPGTFTFRSDHTIEFGPSSPKGFGACAGQSSIRQVRGSMMPTINMPGSFPPAPSPSSHPNKENRSPSPSKFLKGAPHGMTNKKRRRVSTDEEDAQREDAERAIKKQKNQQVPEGDALLAPRLIGSTPGASAKKLPAGRATPNRTPSRTPGRTPSRTPSRVTSSVSPTKKRAVLSMSRLNMLSRPKERA